MAPILFEFSRVTVFSLWFFIALGFAIGAASFTHLAKRHRVKLDLVFEHSVLLFVLTLTVSRLTYIAGHIESYRFATVFNLWDKGFSFWGAIIAWSLTLYYLAWKNGESAEKIFDVMVPGLALGMLLGHIGAFLDGINYGLPTDMPWGVSFRSPNVKYITAIHPTQLYATLYTLLTFLLSYKLYISRAKNSPGTTTLASIALYSAGKFAEEFFRGDETLQIFGIRGGQIVAFVALGISLYLLNKRLRPNTDFSFPTTISYIKRIFPRVRTPHQSRQDAQVPQKNFRYPQTRVPADAHAN